MKKPTLLLCALFLSTPLALAQGDASAVPLEGEPTRMLRLATGDILWGSIAAHDPDGLSFHRVDNDGVLALPWAVLDPAEAEELRLRFGYVDTQTEELMVDAERLQLADGTELTGVITDNDENYLWLKRSEGTTAVPKLSLRGPSSRVRVPALDIYTKDELYQKKAFELQERLLLDGAEGAAAHDEMAQYCETLFDFVHALEHYQFVAKLDPTYQADRIGGALARTEKKAANQEQVDLLAQIDLWRARRRYDLAIEGLRLFSETYPDSPLFEDLNKLRDRVAKYQERDLRKEIVRVIHSQTVRIARDAARHKKTYEEVLGYIDEGMAQDLFKRAQESLQKLAPGIEAEEIERIWRQREGGKRRQASFGLGTWLLGESRALATYDDKEEEPEPERGSQAEARQKLEDRIDRYLRNQELARKAKSSSGGEDGDPAKFWTEWPYAGRYQWVQAYFVEFS